jgi:hypothetical protein
LAALILAVAVLVLPPAAAAQSTPVAWWATASTPVDAVLNCNVYRAYTSYLHALLDALLPTGAGQLAGWSDEPVLTWAHDRATALADALPDFRHAELLANDPTVVGISNGQPVLMVNESEVLISGRTYLAEQMTLAYRFAQAVDDSSSWHVADVRVLDSARHRLDPDAVQVVSAAFSTYLARLDAVATGTSNLDSLDDVMAGSELDNARGFFSGLRGAGTYQQMQPELTVYVVDVEGDDADLAVHGQVHYTLFDPRTAQPLSEATKDVAWNRRFHLQRFDGATWKVTFQNTLDAPTTLDAAGCAAVQ